MRYWRRYVKHIYFLQVLLLVTLVGCSHVQPQSATFSEAIFTDEDLAEAQFIEGETEPIIASDEAETLQASEMVTTQARERQPTLSTQALPNAWEDAPGYIYFVKRFQNQPKSQLVRYQPSTAESQVLYETRFEIQSVAGSADGTRVIFSFNYQGNTKQEVFLLELSPVRKLTRVTRSADIAEVDVSMTADGRLIAWQGLHQGQRSIFYRKYREDFGSFQQRVLVYASAGQLEPQLSPDGSNLVFSREHQKIYSYHFARQRYRLIHSMTAGNLRSPSISNEGFKVAWLETTANERAIYIKDMSTGQLNKVLTSPDIYLDLNDPHLSADGNWLSYGHGTQGVNNNLRQVWLYHTPSRLHQAATNQSTDHWSHVWTMESLVESAVVFVAQMPIPSGFTTFVSTFGNHQPDLWAVGRGSDLWIRYADGSLKNLTQAAGYGQVGFQSEQAIAVRDPAVHWNGTKIIFGMVTGAPKYQYDYSPLGKWQLYEMTGLGKFDTPVIRKVANQPISFNNVSPLYGSDDRIIFTSDRPRNGAMHLYPQLDEYELAPTNTGIWSLNPANGNLKLLDHSPSGDFDPILHSAGRIIFTRWDHLQRDQQADADAMGTGEYGTFNYSNESANAVILPRQEELFPEPRATRTDLLEGTPYTGHNFNQFFPWQLSQDGTGLETLNHIGRHELANWFAGSRNDDPNVRDFFIGDLLYDRANELTITSLFQFQEDPLQPGLFYATEAAEFGTHAAGQIVTLDGHITDNPDDMLVGYVTHPDTANSSDNPSADHSGLYRDPLPLSTGQLIAAHTANTREDSNEGSTEEPISRYDFKLKVLKPTSGDYLRAGASLTGGIYKEISYWTPDVLVEFSGIMWEINPVELKRRTRPPLTSYQEELPSPEAMIFAELGVDVEAFREDLRQRNLALVISRDVTVRDRADRQQPYNLKVATSDTQTIGAQGTVYEVAYMQFYQADQLRGWGINWGDAQPGRRVLAEPMHDSAVINPPLEAAPEGSVVIAEDGSMVALVPAARALTWQLTDTEGEGVVRERNWLTFQAGEVRVCASCHGVNRTNQAGGDEAQNSPEALREFLNYWKNLP